MKLLILSLVSLFSVAAIAGNRCIEQASDADLVNELAFRLRAPGPQNYNPAVQNTFIFSCDVYGTMKVLIVNQATGATKTTNQSFASNSACTSTKTTLEAKIAQRRPGVILAASCDVYGTLKKVVLNGEQLTSESISFANNSACTEAANVLNK